MCRYSILLVDDDQDYITTISSYFSTQEHIERLDIAVDGEQALEKLSANTYDALVMDLVLPKLDGLGLLERLKAGPIEPPMILVASAIRNESMIHYTSDLGVRYYMIKPVKPELLYNRIMCFLDDFEEKRKNTTALTLSEKISDIFHTIGIPANIKGYQFLKEAIVLACSNPKLINRITKELYPAVAAAYATTPGNVDRAIRHAIEIVWNRGKIENINKLFGCSIYSQYEKPTNGEFIALLTDKLIIEQEQNRDKISGNIA